ncbi:MAG: metal-dependent phosphohydrolase [Kangiellaceae bacterium]|jgi:5'-deoxynucleotidase|nr:metal-dependent phosphohydrolase [Kangiellaceae bacterium]|tara:strand:+ start:2455 stop:3156 length:702 start_codon:yes stop_codon:yes gene_type:complete
MLTLRDIIRSGHLTRWHSVRVQREQTLAEHHFMVTMIARAIARKVLKQHYCTEWQLLLVDYTLNHDLAEVLTGDIPSNTKRRLEAMEPQAAEKLRELEESCWPVMKKLEAKLQGTPLKAIVKLADLADAIIYLKQEGHSNHAVEISKKAVLELSRVIASQVDTVDLARLEKETQAIFNKPFSHTHGIELKLIEAYRLKVTAASKAFPQYSWDEANSVLDMLSHGEDAQLAFEY